MRTNDLGGIQPSLTINEDAKTGTNATFYRKQSEKLHLLEIVLEGQQNEDRAYIQQFKGSTSGIDRMDGYKFPHDGFSLATLADGNGLEVFAVGEIMTSGSIPLRVSSPSVGSYTFSALTFGDFEGIELSVKDNFTGEIHSLSGGKAYSFTPFLNTFFILNLLRI